MSWEHKYTYKFDNVKEWGLEGWELVTVVAEPGASWIYFMKRPVQVELNAEYEGPKIVDPVFGEYDFGEDNDE